MRPSSLVSLGTRTELNPAVRPFPQVKSVRQAPSPVVPESSLQAHPPPRRTVVLHPRQADSIANAPPPVHPRAPRASPREINEGFGPSTPKSDTIPWPLLTPARPSNNVPVVPVRFLRTDAPASQDRTQPFPPGLAGFATVRVRMVIGRRHPLPAYPTAPASYPGSVCRIRLLRPASFGPRLAATPLLLASSPRHQACWGLEPLRFARCLAHEAAPPAAGAGGPHSSQSSRPVSAWGGIKSYLTGRPR